MNIAAILTALRPGEAWALSGNTYDGLTWLADTPKPTKTEMEKAWPQVERDLANAEARSNRHYAFQTEADPLFFAWQRNESTEQAWLDKCAEIRDRFPYS
jgi:hypothetical protein